MSKDKQSPLVMVLFLLVLVALVVLAVLFILVPLALLIGGLYYFVMYRKGFRFLCERLNARLDVGEITPSYLWLTPDEKKHFRDLIYRENNILQEAAAIDAQATQLGLTRNQDGSISKRSSKGKAAQERIEELLSLAPRYDQSIQELAALPETLWRNVVLNHVRAWSFMAAFFSWCIATVVLSVPHYSGLKEALYDLTTFPFKVGSAFLSGFFAETDVGPFDGTQETWVIILTATALAIVTYFLTTIGYRVLRKSARKPPKVDTNNIDNFHVPAKT